MMVSHPLFDGDGQPLGEAIQAWTGEVQFIPLGADEPLPRVWSNVEACRRAVIQMQERNTEAA
jgi:hypothetical protein